MFKVYLDAPDLGKEEKKYLLEAINTGYVSAAGPLVQRFEERFANFLGVKKAVSVQSGTAALHTALYQLGIGQRDQVIVPALTFVATVNPIMYVGAKPVFVDVDIETFNIDPEEIKKKITKNTKAIIPVHLYGNPCNMDEIISIARRHNLYVIEDAAESLGAKYKARQTGTFGDLGCFSFNGNKIITTGGGGMIVGNNQYRVAHMKFLVNQARDQMRQGYYHPEIGFNYRMTNIEAALGLAQMGGFKKFLAKKKKFNSIYREELKNIDFIRFQEEYENATSSYWLTGIIFEKKIDIPALQKKLNSKGIPTRRIFMPITEFPPYKAYKRNGYKNSYYIHNNGLCLPSSTINSIDGIYYICKILKSIL